MMCGMNVAPNKANVVPTVYTLTAVSGTFIVPPHNLIKIETYGPGAEGGSAAVNGNISADNATFHLNFAQKGFAGINAGGTQAGGAGGTASGGNTTNTSGTAGRDGTGALGGYGGENNGPAGGARTLNVAGASQPGIAGNQYGGGGSGATNGAGAGGGGGGGGGYSRSDYPPGTLAPGQSVAYTAGAGGAGGGAAGNGFAGVNIVTIT